MVTSKPTMIFSRLPADVKATGFSRYVVYSVRPEFSEPPPAGAGGIIRLQA